MILPTENNQIELRYLKNYLKVFLHMSISLTHKNLTGVTPITFRLVWGQIRALTLPKLFQYVEVSNFSGKISHNHATEFTPEHAGNNDRDKERLIHRFRCHSLCSFFSFVCLFLFLFLFLFFCFCFCFVFVFVFVCLFVLLFGFVFCFVLSIFPDAWSILINV